MSLKQRRVINALLLALDSATETQGVMVAEIEKQNAENEQLKVNFDKAQKNFNSAAHEATKAAMQRDWLVQVSNEKTELIVNLKVEIAQLKSVIEKSKTAPKTEK